jgi:hypothetical protein
VDGFQAPGAGQTMIGPSGDLEPVCDHVTYHMKQSPEFVADRLFTAVEVLASVVIKIRIGINCWWTPDFLVLYRDLHLELHDTKGGKGKRGQPKTYHAEDDAIVKARAVSEAFVIPVWFIWRQHDGEWTRKEM